MAASTNNNKLMGPVKKAAAPKPAKAKVPTMDKGENDWRARDDLATLTRAEEIKSDSKRARAVEREASRQLKQLAKLSPSKATTRTKTGR